MKLGIPVLVLGLATSVLAGVSLIFTQKDFDEAGGVVTSTYALQGPINNDDPLVNCLEDAKQDVRNALEEKVKIAKVVCVPAGWPKLDGSPSGYKVILHDAKKREPEPKAPPVPEAD
ncbi:hypothetical protein K2X33_01725 [bacterium]|nr:hypothetical protein [bacterium]